MTASSNLSEMELKPELKEEGVENGPAFDHLHTLRKKYASLHECSMQIFKAKTQNPCLSLSLHYQQFLLQNTLNLKACCQTFGIYQESVATQKLPKIDDCSRREVEEAKPRAAAVVPQTSTEVMPNITVKVESSASESKATQTSLEALAAKETPSKGGGSSSGDCRGNGEEPVEKSLKNPAETPAHQEDIAYVNLDAAELMWKAANLKADIAKGTHTTTNTNEGVNGDGQDL